jgi:hypothetical protein
MYCSHCGQPVYGGQRVCPSCGQPIVAQPPIWQGPAVTLRVHRHLHGLAVLWLVYAAWTVLTWLVALPFLTGAFGRWHGGEWGGGMHSFFPHMTWLIPFISIIVIARAVLSAAVGFGLLRRAPWARTLALVAAFLTLIKPITGTALAIYTLWVLLPGASGQEYSQITGEAGYPA